MNKPCMARSVFGLLERRAGSDEPIAHDAPLIAGGLAMPQCIIRSALLVAKSIDGV